MKKRNLPYGYQYSNGAAVLHPVESRILKEIAEAYLSGASLQDIAIRLNEQHVEYMPGIISWNKSRLMRILEDERHLGDSQYPPIIDSDTHHAILAAKARRNTQKNMDRKPSVLFLGIPIICPLCGKEMKRRQDLRNDCHQRWFCINETCKRIIPIRDNDLLAAVNSILKNLSNNPEQIHTCTSAPTQTPEIERMEREIKRALNGIICDKETIQKKLMDCLSQKYQGIGNSQIVSNRLRATLEEARFQEAEPIDLIQRTVTQIQLHIDGSVGLTLVNDQRIGWEG